MKTANPTMSANARAFGVALPGVFALLGLVAFATFANAASPEYCAFYAREYVQQFEFSEGEAATELQLGDEAYYRCLNQDEPPLLPAVSAYSGSELDGRDLAADLIAQGDTDYEEVELAEPEQALAVAETEPVEQAAPAETRVAAAKPQRKSRSGLPAWTPEWEAWCEKHFPNSFDPETGFVLPFDGVRRFC